MHSTLSRVKCHLEQFNQNKAANLLPNKARLRALAAATCPSILPRPSRPPLFSHHGSFPSSKHHCQPFAVITMATSTQTVIEQEVLDGIQHNPKIPAVVDVAPSSAGRALSSTPSSSPPSSTHEPPAEAERPKLSTLQAWIVIIQLCGNNVVNSFSAGVLMVCLPIMAADLRLPSNLLLWPNSVSALTSGSCFLIMGSVSDVLGARRMNIPGSFLQSVFIIATGFSQNGAELIAFRALGGVANALFSPSARSILSNNIAHGRLRNFGFATMFLAFPLGAGLGLVLGGIYADKASWRVAYWSSGALGLVLSLMGLWTLPKDEKPLSSAKEALKRLALEIDWLGVLLASASAALLSYVFAMLSANADEIHRPTNIALFSVSIALIPAFALWMHRQEKLQKPAVIPNSLWRDSRFTSICLMIGLSNGAQSGLSLFCSLLYVFLHHRFSVQVLTLSASKKSSTCQRSKHLFAFSRKLRLALSAASLLASSSIAYQPWPPLSSPWSSARSHRCSWRSPIHPGHTGTVPSGLKSSAHSALT